MARRQTSPEDDPQDLNRLSDNLFIDQGALIFDRDSFNLGLVKYAADIGISKSSKDKLFDIYKKDHKGISSERLQKKAGGKSLERDRQQTAKTVVQTREEFIRRGARRVDFAGFDIKESQIRRMNLKSLKGFSIKATVKDRVVFAKRSTIILKGKRRIVLRDRRGRFASSK